MTIPAATLFPRTGDTQTIYLKPAITNPNIQVGDYTMYNDFVHDPRDFQRNNVLYHYPVNGDKLIIGKFCSIACTMERNAQKREAAVKRFGSTKIPQVRTICALRRPASIMRVRAGRRRMRVTVMADGSSRKTAQNGRKSPHKNWQALMLGLLYRNSRCNTRDFLSDCYRDVPI